MTIDNTQDIIDVRDIIERIEELENDIDTQCTASAYGLEKDAEFKAELATLTAIMDDLKGNGGDEQWRGDWYPLTIIRDSYFETYCIDLADDCGYTNDNSANPLLHYIDWAAWARDCKYDYSSTEIDGVTYLYR